MPIRHTLQRHILVIGSIIVVAGLIAASDTLHGQTEQIIVWIEALISRLPVLGMLVFVLPAMVSAMLAFFSSAVCAPIAIFAWGKTVTQCCSGSAGSRAVSFPIASATFWEDLSPRRCISRGVLPARAEPRFYPAWNRDDSGKRLRVSAVPATCRKNLTSSGAETRMHETAKADDLQSSTGSRGFV